MEEEKVKKPEEKHFSVMKWFQKSYLRMYFGLTFIWCINIFFVLFILAAREDPTITIASAVPMSLFFGIGGALYMLVISAGPITRLDEEWRQAIKEDRLPWWIGWIRLILIVMPSYVYGWIPQKAYDWYFYKFTYLFAGLRLAEEEKYCEAIAELEQYKPSKSDVEENYTLYSTLGNCYIGIEEFDKAVASYQQAISFKPDDLKVQINLAQAYVLNNQHNEGLELLQKLHQMLPEDVDVLGIIARSYITLEMDDDALNYVKTALSLKPMEPVFHKMLAEIYLGKDMKKEAIESATKALSLNPSPVIAEEARQIIDILQNNDKM